MVRFYFLHPYGLGEPWAPRFASGAFWLPMEIPIDRKLIEEFRTWLLLQDLSKDSSEAYSRTLISYCLNKLVVEVNDKAFFFAFREKMRTMGRTQATTSRHIWAIKKFLTFLSQEKGVSIINIFSIRCRKSKPPPTTYLEKWEIDLFRKYPITNVFDLRTRAMFEFLIFTGCRISECVGADVAGINFQTNELTVTGKGSKTRIVFLGNSGESIRNYLKERGEAEPLFINYYGNRLDRKMAGIRIREMASRAGIEKRVFPHMIRATFATHMIRAGVDPKTLQEMLGHEDIETTLRHYVGVSHEYMRAKHEEFSISLGA